MKFTQEKNAISSLEKEKLLHEGTILRAKTLALCVTMREEMRKSSIVASMIGCYASALISGLNDVKNKKLRGSAAALPLLLPKLIFSLWEYRRETRKTVVLLGVLFVAMVSRSIIYPIRGKISSKD